MWHFECFRFGQPLDLWWYGAHLVSKLNINSTCIIHVCERDASLKSHRVFFRNWPICGFNFNLIKNNMTLTLTTAKEPGKHNQLQINRIKLFWLRCVTFIAIAIRFTARVRLCYWIHCEHYYERHSKFETLNKSVAKQLYSQKNQAFPAKSNVLPFISAKFFFLYFDFNSHSNWVAAAHENKSESEN